VSAGPPKATAYELLLLPVLVLLVLVLAPE
jgi:hypothetical protein